MDNILVLLPLSLTHLIYKYIMNSKMGFICEVLYDDNTQDPYMKAFVLMDVDWSAKGAHQSFYENFKHGIEFRKLDSLWGAVLTEQKVVLSNDVVNDPRSHGTPRWHAKMEYVSL